ncbi:unnamed protein product [Amoebophrya sp. A25]|nr:unnamed protein product [Amoebophrya sp. A25]|eukprot:GSA25T00011028001.1
MSISRNCLRFYVVLYARQSSRGGKLLRLTCRLNKSSPAAAKSRYCKSKCSHKILGQC